MIGEFCSYRAVKIFFENMLNPFHTIPERNGQTDRQTDEQTDRMNCYINIARQSVC